MKNEHEFQNVLVFSVSPSALIKAELKHHELHKFVRPHDHVLQHDLRMFQIASCEFQCNQENGVLNIVIHCHNISFFHHFPPQNFIILDAEGLFPVVD